MNIYLAPMEGLTGHIFRRTHHACYGSLDKYYTPFIVPGRERSMRTREKKEVLPENNAGMRTVPQILTSQADLFVRLASELQEMGYTEVNLNLGCPSGTVASRGRGAGFLGHPEELDRFLEQIFDQCPIAISVKSRIGVESESEFEGILAIFNRYPMTELILHPRLRTDYYKNHPHMEAFRMAAENFHRPLVYNGDLFTVEDIRRITEEFPELSGIMLGRGLMADPGLRDRLAGEKPGLEQLKHFHDLLYQGYKEEMSGDRNLMYRMKELWFYLEFSFRGTEEFMKKLRKISSAAEYRSWAERLFREAEYCPEQGFQPPL